MCVCLKANSRVIQQQHNGVKFFSGSVISSEWHDEVIEPVPRRLRRHDDELVFETIRLGILKAVVPATLHRKGREERGKKRYFFGVFLSSEGQRDRVGGWRRGLYSK